MTAPVPKAPTAEPPSAYDPRIRTKVERSVFSELKTRRRGLQLPPGSHSPSLRNTLTAVDDGLGLLLDHYRRYGPVFTIRLVHQPIVWAISPQATHEILVTEADAFSWRKSRFGDLWPLLGNSFFAIDGPYHHQTRRMLLPNFHAGAVEGTAQKVIDEVAVAADALTASSYVDVNHWVRELAMRVALRVLADIPEDHADERPFAHEFERALSFFGLPLPVQMLRGPGTPYADMQAARAALDRMILAEVERRRGAGEFGGGVLGMLLSCTDEAGEPLPGDTLRDHLATVLFAGHDTTTATMSFLVHELGRTPHARDELLAEIDDVLGGDPPRPEHLDGKALPVLERTINETLRRFPPAWHGPRHTVRDVELDGVLVPKGTDVHYSSWATHHLPEYYTDPVAFRPDRFLPGGEVDQLPKGAYVPFGGGSRMCLGKRFAQYEIRAITIALCQRVVLDLDPARPLRLSVAPTIGPKDGLPVFVRPRARPSQAQAA